MFFGLLLNWLRDLPSDVMLIWKAVSLPLQGIDKVQTKEFDEVYDQLIVRFEWLFRFPHHGVFARWLMPSLTEEDIRQSEAFFELRLKRAKEKRPAITRSGGQNNGGL